MDWRIISILNNSSSMTAFSHPSNDLSTLLAGPFYISVHLSIHAHFRAIFSTSNINYHTFEPAVYSEKGEVGIFVLCCAKVLVV